MKCLLKFFPSFNQLTLYLPPSTYTYSVAVPLIVMGTCRMDNYTLQVTGEENYITGNVRLLDFKAVRK